MLHRPRFITNPARPLRSRRRQRRQRLLAVRSVRDSLISLAGLVGSPVRNPTGDPIGRVADVVARWDGTEAYPAVTGLVVKIGGRRAFVSMDQVRSVSRAGVEMQSARLDLLEFARREGEVLLATDVLDHQLVDVDGVQVIRSADLYLAWTPGSAGQVLRLVGVDVSGQTLLRRLGPKRWRTVPTPERVIDWATIRPFGSEVPTVALTASLDEVRRLRPGELADLLEDLGRDARQEPWPASSPRPRRTRSRRWIQKSSAPCFARHLWKTPPPSSRVMEPDEAVDALRDLEEDARDEILEHMDPEQRELLDELLDYEEDRAGGFMTTQLVVASPDEAVRQVRRRLRKDRRHAGDIDGIVVVDSDGLSIGDIPLFEFAIATNDSPVAGLLPEGEAVSVPVDAGITEVAERLVDTRRSSVVVVDGQNRPVGRILADDLVDALMPERGRRRFPRFLS